MVDGSKIGSYHSGHASAEVLQTALRQADHSHKVRTSNTFLDTYDYAMPEQIYILLIHTHTAYT